jgi:hypothetical protein
MDKEKVFIIFHTFDNGHQIEVFKNEKDARKFQQELFDEYTEEYGEEVNEENICDIAQSCNIEFLEQELK